MSLIQEANTDKSVILDSIASLFKTLWKSDAREFKFKIEIKCRLILWLGQRLNGSTFCN